MEFVEDEDFARMFHFRLLYSSQLLVICEYRDLFYREDHIYLCSFIFQAMGNLIYNEIYPLYN